MNSTPADRPTWQAPAAPGELAELYRSWGILDLVEGTVERMPPEWLRILEIARNLLAGKTIPGIDVPADLTGLIHHTKEGVATRRVKVQVRTRLALPPKSDAIVTPLRDLRDFPHITASELLLRDRSRRLFNYRLLSGSVDALYNVERTPSLEEYEEIIEEDAPEEEAPEEEASGRKRQKVYALLDVSNSMRDHNKVIFAKALMLAYLVKASQERADIYFRTFANTVHARSDCHSAEDFAALAQRVLSVAPDGGTDIKDALGSAIGDIRHIDDMTAASRIFDAPDTEILLISDCESYSIPHVPQRIKLHTVHLKGGRMMTAYREGFERIKAESATFNEIDTTELDLPDSARERWLLRQEQTRLATSYALDISTDEAQAITAKLELLQAAYERMAETGGRRSGFARGVKSMSPQRLSLRALVAAMAAAVGALLHPRRGHATRRSAMVFRQRH
jgi:hypothetical protein